jgi:hypothetical protein
MIYQRLRCPGAGVIETDSVKVRSGSEVPVENTGLDQSPYVHAAPYVIAVSEEENAIAASGLAMQPFCPPDSSSQRAGTSAEADVKMNEKSFYTVHN